MSKTKQKLLTKTFSLVALTTIVLHAIVSHASDLDPGFYLGADLGKSSYKQTSVSSEDPAFGLKLGYQFTPHLATEVLFRSLSFNLDGPFSSSAYYPDSNRSIAVLGILPIDANFSTNARLGFGKTSMHSSRLAKKDYQKSETLVSIGGSYSLTQNWRLNLEATRFNQSSVTLITVGTEIHF
jgi:hypothetical protein